MKQRKTLQIYGSVNGSNKFKATLRVPFVCGDIILKSYSFTIDALESNVASDLVYIIRSNITQDTNVLCHFAPTLQWNDITGPGYIITYTIHADPNILFKSVEEINGEFEFVILNVAGETPSLSTWGNLGYALTLEVHEK
jgi:hypothetical protein